MAEGTIKIKEMEELTELTDNDYFVVDNLQSGVPTKKYKATRVIQMIENVADEIEEKITPSIDTALAIGSASGDIASFSDGSTLPMPKLQVGIEPQQDLHGYDYPWAGGSGKNKCNPSAETVTVEANIINSLKLGEVVLNDTTSIIASWYQNTAINGRAVRNTITLRLKNDKTREYYATNVTTAPLNAGTHESPINNVPAGTYDVILWAQECMTGYVASQFMVRLATETDPTFEPYSNICPISGHTEANVVVSPTTDAEDGQTYNIQFKDGDNPLTVYGGTLDVVSGELKVVPYYASYNGETLEGEWISDRDVYAVGTTPTIGAQVVNIGATPQTYQLTPTQVKSLLGSNNVRCDTGEIIDCEYKRDATAIINSLIARIEALENQ